MNLNQDRREKQSALMTISQKIFGTVEIHDPRPSKERVILIIIAQVAAALLVAYGEWPFNSVSFQVLGSLSNEQCSYVALAIGAVMGFLAFGTGYSLKKGWVTGSGKWWILGFILTLVSIGGIYTLSVMRAEYLRQNAEDGTTMLNPATQTALTYMIFLGGVMVEFFCSRVHKFPEDFSAYCKMYAEYEKILAKIKAAEDAITDLNTKLHSELSKESELIIAKTKIELSRNEELQVAPAVQPEPKSDVLPQKSKQSFEETYNIWKSKNNQIENDLNEQKENLEFKASGLDVLIKSQEASIELLDKLVVDESEYVQNWWIERKQSFRYLKNRVKNETK